MLHCAIMLCGFRSAPEVCQQIGVLPPTRILPRSIRGYALLSKLQRATPPLRYRTRGMDIAPLSQGQTLNRPCNLAFQIAEIFSIGALGHPMEMP